MSSKLIQGGHVHPGHLVGLLMTEVQKDYSPTSQ